MDRIKTVVIVETKWWGHHPSYVKKFIRIFVELKAEVICACPSPREVQDWVSGEPMLQGKVTCVKLPSHKFFSRLELNIRNRHPHRANLFRWIAVRIVLERARRKTRRPVDLVFMSMLDDYLFTSQLDYRLDIVMPYPWTGLVLFPKLPEIERARWGVPPRRIEAAFCKGIFFLQETAVSAFGRATGKRCESFPDFTDTSVAPADSQFSTIQKIREAARGRKIVGLYGALGKRKGILLLLKCAAEVKNDPIFFVVAGESIGGRQDPDLLFFENELRTGAYPNIFFSRGMIPTEADFNALVEVSSVIWLVYPNWPYSSNLLTKAAYWKKPVIAAEGGILADRVRRFGLGITADAYSIPALVQGLRVVCLGNTASINSAGFDDYCKMHSEDRLRDILSRLLETGDSDLPEVHDPIKGVFSRLRFPLKGYFVKVLHALRKASRAGRDL